MTASATTGVTTGMAVRLIDGTRVVVPESLDLITPYVLLEQEDWFEEEIKFLRRLLRTGMQVIDIGANYGVYALSMARAVGPSGRVWAFEPASGTAAYLAQGIAANGFGHVTLVRSALSGKEGFAQLALNDHSELNALVRDAASAVPVETVPVTTLDALMASHGWRNIDLVKIDAEGEEAGIIEGGRAFFEEQSPLVQYEVRVGEEVNEDLVTRFAGIGYDSYRLVPGLHMLAPFEPGTADSYLLNLFCCKRDRASRLAADGLLAEMPSAGSQAQQTMLGDIRRRIRTQDRWHWRSVLARLPYGAMLADGWERESDTESGETAREILALHAFAHDPSQPATERAVALAAAVSELEKSCAQKPSITHLSSLARTARDLGARKTAIGALTRLLKLIRENNAMVLDQPFLAPGERFDQVPPGAAPGNWMLAAALEELERLAFHSSFYSGANSRGRLEAIRDLGFGSEEMKRRLDLLQKRFGFRAG